jgi:HAD superfamily hydrolase (TIGR01509 family)
MAEAGPPFTVTHVLFDVDNTLVDFDIALGNALRAAAERCSELTGTIVTTAALQTARNLVIVEPQWRRALLADARRESLRRVLAAGGVTEEAATDEVTELLFRARAETTPVYPDVIPTLETLRERGFRLIAASNGNLDLAVPGLDHYFEASLFAADAEHLKPDPRFFRQAVDLVGGTPAAIVAVGDTPANDYDPAAAAGLQPVLIDGEGAFAGASMLRIASLAELPAMLELGLS